VAKIVRDFHGLLRRLEGRALLRVNHDNIATLYSIFEENSRSIVLLVEYGDCGSLDDVLHGNKKKINYSYRDAINWMHQCVKDWIHRDLAPSKLLLMHDCQALKISFLRKNQMTMYSDMYCTLLFHDFQDGSPNVCIH